MLSFLHFFITINNCRTACLGWGGRSQFDFPEDWLVKDIRVSVNVEHSYLRDVKVTLYTSLGKDIVLHNRLARKDKSLVKTYNVGSVPELRTCIGERIQGKWSLKVADYSKGNTGSFLSWRIIFLVQEAEKEELKREIFPWLIIPDSYPAGIESRIEIERPGKILKLEVSLEITHSSTGDLKVELVMPSGEKLALLNRMESGRKKFKETFITETEENLQPAISKEMQGIWTLKISNLAKHEGTLDSWGLHFIYEIDS